MTFVDKVNKREERKCPVRTEVKKAAGYIREGREAGKKLDTIFWALKEMGLKVGARPNSFRNAVKYLDKHGWDHGPSLPPSSPTSAARDRFIDDRHESDF